MSKFKKGDRARMIAEYCELRIGDIVQCIVDDGSNRMGWAPVDDLDKSWWVYDNKLELIKEGDTKVKQRRTFKLLKDTPNVKKGALWQEQCEDGTQPYELISTEFIIGQPPERPLIQRDRTVIEEQPQWFVEVFKVTPEYMTQEELDQWESFKAPKKRGRPAGVKVEKKTTKKRKPVSEETRAKMRASRLKAYKKFGR